MSKIFNLKAAALFSVFTFAAVAHYYHWDDRLVQIAKEIKTDIVVKQKQTWFDDYYVEIENRVIKPLEIPEMSGLTWHEPTNTLFTVTGKHSKIAQLSLEGEMLRSIDLIGAGNSEGITALPDGRFAIVSERSCILYIFAIPDDADSIDFADQTLVKAVDLAEHHPHLLLPANKGLEGIAWDEKNHRFLMAKEKRPAAIFELPYNLQDDTYGEFKMVASDNLFIRDLSGLAIDPQTGNLLALSHESALVLVLNDAFEVINFMSFTAGVNGISKRIQQAEGIAMDGQGTLYVVGEPAVFYSFKEKAGSQFVTQK